MKSVVGISASHEAVLSLNMIANTNKTQLILSVLPE